MLKYLGDLAVKRAPPGWLEVLIENIANAAVPE
jgi:hypothetical protein